MASATCLAMSMAINRPTSPHLTIYRWQISSVLSILHRFTGLWLTLGLLVLVSWLYVVAYTPGDYEAWYKCISSLPGKLLLASWMAAFYYHFCNGIRHLFWDIGKGYSLPQMHFTGWLVVLGAALLSIMTWGFVQAATGAAG
jgi:succinate dehydrogenase / fumarate reductase cytochrome b subunit